MALITKHNDPFRLVDRTDELLLIPNMWTLTGDLGLFRSVPVVGTTFYVDEQDLNMGLLVDLPRGTKPAAGRENSRRRRHYELPHFPIIQAIRPQDIKQISRTGDGQPTTLDQKRLEKMEFIRRSFTITQEAARTQLLQDGTVYAPNGNVIMNYYTEYGVTRKEIDFVLGTGTTKVLNKGEEAIAHIQDNLMNGGQMSGTIALCHPTFFSRLITHASVEAAYQFYNSAQEPLRQRLGGSNAMYRRFEHGGVTYIEYRGARPDGTPYIPAGECRIFPSGTDFFKTYFGSADTFDLINTPGQEAYYFEKMSEDDNEWKIMAETNFANAVLNPKILIRGYSSN